MSESYISALMKAEIKKGSARDSKASLEPFAILALLETHSHNILQKV